MFGPTAPAASKRSGPELSGSGVGGRRRRWADPCFPEAPGWRSPPPSLPRTEAAPDGPLKFEGRMDDIVACAMAGMTSEAAPREGLNAYQKTAITGVTPIEKQVSGHRRRLKIVLMLCFGVLAHSVALGSVAQGSSAGTSMKSSSASAAGTICDKAKQRVKQSGAKLARAKAALRSASTPAAKEAARKQVKKAKRQLAAAKRAREQACPPETTPPGAKSPPNQPPSFPTQTVQGTYENQYTIVLGKPCLSSQTVKITISPGASDPDGDPLTYSWAASNGSISGSGLTATWTRLVQNCAAVPGTVTVTASDGKGGTAQYQRGFS